jgi:uncharacterized integral membrane protein
MAEVKQRRGGTLGFIVGFGIGIPATVFALSNLEATNVEFLGWAAQVPLWAVIALSLVAGVLLGVTMLLGWQARRKHGRKKAAKQAARQQPSDPPAVEAPDPSAEPPARP